MKFYPVFICDNFMKRCRLAGDLPVPYLTKGTVYGVMYDLRNYPATYFTPTDHIIHGEVYMLPRSLLRVVCRRLNVRYARVGGEFMLVKVGVTTPDGSQMVALGFEYCGHSQLRLQQGDVPRIKSGDWRKYRGMAA